MNITIFDTLSDRKENVSSSQTLLWRTILTNFWIIQWQTFSKVWFIIVRKCINKFHSLEQKVCKCFLSFANYFLDWSFLSTFNIVNLHFHRGILNCCQSYFRAEWNRNETFKSKRKDSSTRMQVPDLSPRSGVVWLNKRNSWLVDWSECHIWYPWMSGFSKT